jgi:hypothetical protein
MLTAARALYVDKRYHAKQVFEDFYVKVRSSHQPSVSGALRSFILKKMGGCTPRLTASSLTSNGGLVPRDAYTYK